MVSKLINDLTRYRDSRTLVVVLVLTIAVSPAAAQEAVVFELPLKVGELIAGETTYNEARKLYGRPDERSRSKSLIFAKYEDIGLRAVFHREKPNVLASVELSGTFAEVGAGGIRSGMPAADARDNLVQRLGRPYEETGYYSGDKRLQDGSMNWRLGSKLTSPYLRLSYSGGHITTVAIYAYSPMRGSFDEYLREIPAAAARTAEAVQSLPGSVWQSVKEEGAAALQIHYSYGEKLELIRFFDDGGCTYTSIDESDFDPEEHTVETCSWETAGNELAIYDERGGIVHSGTFGDAGELTGAVWVVGSRPYAWRAIDVTDSVDPVFVAFVSSPRERKLPIDYVAEYAVGEMTWSDFLDKGWMTTDPDYYVDGIIRMEGLLDDTLTVELGQAISNTVEKVNTSQLAREQALSFMQAGLAAEYEAGFFSSMEFILYQTNPGEYALPENQVEVACTLVFEKRILASNSCFSGQD